MGRIYQTHGDRIMLDFNVENADPAYYNLTGTERPSPR